MIKALHNVWGVTTMCEKTGKEKSNPVVDNLVAQWYEGIQLYAFEMEINSELAAREFVVHLQCEIKHKEHLRL